MRSRTTDIIYPLINVHSFLGKYQNSETFRLLTLDINSKPKCQLLEKRGVLWIERGTRVTFSGSNAEPRLYSRAQLA